MSEHACPSLRRLLSLGSAPLAAMRSLDRDWPRLEGLCGPLETGLLISDEMVERLARMVDYASPLEHAVSRASGEPTAAQPSPAHSSLPPAEPPAAVMSRRALSPSPAATGAAGPASAMSQVRPVAHDARRVGSLLSRYAHTGSNKPPASGRAQAVQAPATGPQRTTVGPQVAPSRTTMGPPPAGHDAVRERRLAREASPPAIVAREASPPATLSREAASEALRRRAASVGASSSTETPVGGRPASAEVCALLERGTEGGASRPGAASRPASSPGPGSPAPAPAAAAPDASRSSAHAWSDKLSLVLDRLAPRSPPGLSSRAVREGHSAQPVDTAPLPAPLRGLRGLAALAAASELHPRALAPPAIPRSLRAELSAAEEAQSDTALRDRLNRVLQSEARRQGIDLGGDE